MILFLFLAPVLSTSSFHGKEYIGGGGSGPAGGGGGGAVGAASEHLRFVAVRPDPTVLPPVNPRPIPPVKPPVPKPALPTPIPTAAIVAATPTTEVGAAQGSGTTGTGGAGPGSGGGIGSGIGPGRGSGVGPGTGGGPGKIYPPTTRELVVPPIPYPASIRGQHLKAWFDVDERGNSTLISFEHSRDAGYNKLLEQTLRATRFRPAVRGDGTAVRDTAVIEIIF